MGGGEILPASEVLGIFAGWALQGLGVLALLAAALAFLSDAAGGFR